MYWVVDDDLNMIITKRMVFFFNDTCELGSIEENN